MKRYEGAPGAQDTISSEIDNFNPEEIVSEFKGSPEALKDHVFNEVAKAVLVKEFFEALEDFFSVNETDQMRAEMTKFSDEEIIAALSLPHELRLNMFERMEQECAAGKDVSVVLREYVERVSKYGFGIGFHTSPLDLRPEEETGRWMIKGTEADHRDGDRLMAYYSTKYRHIYKKKHPKFIYIVRTDPSTHKTDGNWSRSDSLSVITRIPFEQVVQIVESTARVQNENGHQSE